MKDRGCKPTSDKQCPVHYDSLASCTHHKSNPTCFTKCCIVQDNWCHGDGPCLHDRACGGLAGVHDAKSSSRTVSNRSSSLHEMVPGGAPGHCKDIEPAFPMYASGKGYHFHVDYIKYANTSKVVNISFRCDAGPDQKKAVFMEVDVTIDELYLTAWANVGGIQPNFDINPKKLKLHAVATVICHNRTSLEIQLDQAKDSFSIVGKQIGFHIPELFGKWVDLKKPINDAVKHMINNTRINPPSGLKPIVDIFCGHHTEQYGMDKLIV